MKRTKAASPDWAAFGRKGGKARLHTMTKAERQAVARLGVKAFLEQITPKQRKETARKAAEVRWAAYRKTHPKVRKHRASSKKKPKPSR